MLHSIVVVCECAAGVVRRIDEDALDASRILLLQRLEAEEVIALNEDIVEDVVIGDDGGRVIGQRRILDQNARLQPRPDFFARPCEFETSFFVVGHRVGNDLPVAAIPFLGGKSRGGAMQANCKSATERNYDRLRGYMAAVINSSMHRKWSHSSFTATALKMICFFPVD